MYLNHRICAIGKLTYTATSHQQLSGTFNCLLCFRITSWSTGWKMELQLRSLLLDSQHMHKPSPWLTHLTMELVPQPQALALKVPTHRNLGSWPTMRSVGWPSCAVSISGWELGCSQVSGGGRLESAESENSFCPVLTRSNKCPSKFIKCFNLYFFSLTNIQCLTLNTVSSRNRPHTDVYLQ